MRLQGLAAFAIGIALTAWTCVRVLDAQDEQLRRNFDRDTEKIATDTAVRLQIYFDMLLSMKGAFAVDNKLGRAEFSRFVRELKLTQRYPGFQAIQFVRRVRSQELPSYAAEVMADTSLEPAGYPKFDIHPVVQRDEHYIITYNEPMAGNENAFGLDLSGLPPHLRAVEMGRDTGKVIATERITLVQDKTGQPGFVARAPVYREGAPIDTVEQRRAALVGFVAIVFRVNNLLKEVIEQSSHRHIAFRIHDAGNLRDGGNAPLAKNNIMFDTIGTAGTLLPLSRSLPVDVAQRRWMIEFAALPASKYARDITGVILIGAGGFVISALIAALLMASSRNALLAGRLRSALEEQRAFQDSAAVGIALFANGQIQRCNRGMEEVMGYAAGELNGKPTGMLLPGDGDDPFVRQGEAQRWNSELELVRKDGTVIWCLITGKAIEKAGLAKGGVWVIQDITDRKSTEAALVDARYGLEHSLAELEEQKKSVLAAQSDLTSVLATLKQAQTNLITSEKMASLGSLVAGIAHELNTPIGNSLLTATALADMVTEFEKNYEAGGIKRSALEAHLADTRMACGIMANSLRRAADLITSFKQVAVDQTSDKRRSFDLCEVLKDTLATYSAQLRRANCEARVDGPVALGMDSYPGSLGQVLSNLLNNALLHAFEGRSNGNIVITARETDDDMVLIVFSDDGIGMPPKVLHQVFDPFFTTKMGQGGSGLGMNIVYNIVTNMLGGSIDVMSSPEHGTSITIRVPRTAPNRDAEHEEVGLLVK
jgi:PAS domain S-box-containing protein